MAYEIPLKVLSEPAVATIIQHRLLVVSGAGVKHSTATPAAARPIGVAQNAATSSQMVTFIANGVTKVEASTAALTRGVYVSPTSGAASTASRLGGTIKATTVLGNSIGVALTSAAAGAGKRLVSVNLWL